MFTENLTAFFDPENVGVKIATVGGVAGGNILGALIPALAAAAGGGFSIGNLAASGLGGIVLQIVAGIIKSKMGGANA